MSEWELAAGHEPTCPQAEGKRGAVCACAEIRAKEQRSFTDGFAAGLLWAGEPICCTDCEAPVEVVKRGRLMCSADSDHLVQMTRERVSEVLRARDREAGQ